MQAHWQRDRGYAPRRAVRGTALVPTLLLVSGMSIFGLALLHATLGGARTVHHQEEEYRLASAADSAATLVLEQIWSGYLRDQGGAPGPIETMRDYLDDIGLADAGPGGAPDADEGVSWMQAGGFSGTALGKPELGNVNLDSVRIVRRDDGASTRVFLTVSVSTQRGQGIVNPVVNRAVQVVYTIEDADFPGLDFGMLANNVSCVLCHTRIDSTDRYYNADPSAYGSFERVRVGSLRSMLLRSDANSVLNGTLYVRGKVLTEAGLPIADWTTQTLESVLFDPASGHVFQDAFGDPFVVDLAAATEPLAPGENLYIDYPVAPTDMVDGYLPASYPAPFPDDGGIDPATGAPVPGAAGNRTVDDAEFAVRAAQAEGSLAGGSIYVHSGPPIDSAQGISDAKSGNTPSLPSLVSGSVVLSGTKSKPLVIDGAVAIDGDVMIVGKIKGEGALLVSGNVYVPKDLMYLDGTVDNNPNSPRTYGIAKDGTKNSLAIAAGGTVVIGDVFRPTGLNGGSNPDPVSGDEDGLFCFGLAQISLFNREQWAQTQPMLPGAGDDPANPATWSVANPSYGGAGYVPRYYTFSPAGTVPIYNKGGQYFDPFTQSWQGGAEYPVEWDADLLTYAYPADPADPLLHPAGGPAAAVHALTSPGWITDAKLQKLISTWITDTGTDEGLEVDALLYTNNAILGYTPRVGPYEGKMVVNGALVASDMALLSSGDGNPGTIGLQLNYDPRVQTMIQIVTETHVQLKRTLWNPTANLL